ncbi:MAG: pyridoxal phosphate-dependent aminotransferase [Deltaproteobacteria bacterium]|jgi:aspartate aminotransferase|nr:pyridoxal phosphate-dependent aminotransferase [Deltaproteobacteria bacterium]
MRLADRVVGLKASATLAVNALAKDLARSGRDIISLSVGETDFDTPRPIREAAVLSIEEGFTRYTAEAGMPELRQAAADYFNRFYGAGAGAEHILIGNGAKQCLFNIMLAVLNPGDEALIPAPYWVSYPAMVEIAGGKPVEVHTGAERDFKVGVEDLERCYGPKTRICIMNSPSNPTGAVYRAEELDAIAAWAVERNILLLSDEIYDRLVYSPARHYSLCGWWRKRPENFAVVNGVSKSFAMTGWRLGYMLAHEDLIKAATKLQGQSTSNACSISQKAALAALTLGNPEEETMRRSMERRLGLVLEAVSRWPGVLCPRPRGAFYAFPDFHRLYRGEISDSASFCSFLLEKAGVALVPGAAFGDDRCARISYAVEDKILSRALDKIHDALHQA